MVIVFFFLMQALVHRDGNLLSGPLDALVQHMVPTDTYYPDRAYLFAFLLSSRLFIKPHDLLAKVRILCETQQGLGSSSGGAHHPGQARFAEHLVQLLAEWTETFPYDFRCLFVDCNTLIEFALRCRNDCITVRNTAIDSLQHCCPQG